MKFKEQYYTEAKQVGTLYHDTTIYGFINIAKTNKLIDKWPIGSINVFGKKTKRNEISVSRNKNLNWGPIKLILDGNKISNNYKIEPTSVTKLGRPDPYEQLAEELIIVGELKPINKYLIGIGIYEDIELKNLDQLIELYTAIKN